MDKKAENPSRIKVLFWNIWFELQNGKRGNGTEIYKALEAVIRDHSPDVIGLNEVYRVNAKTESVAERVLKAHGYQTYFDYLIIGHDGSMIGNVIASRLEIEEVMTLTFAEDSPASFDWYQTYRPTALRLRVRVSDTSLQVILPHFPVLLPKDLFVHRRQRKAFNQLIDSIGSKNTIIGGDFNEYKILFRLFGKPKGFRVVAGSIFNPTWRLNGSKKTPLIACVDYILYDSKNSLHLVDKKILDLVPSDHAPVVAQFEVM